MHRCWLRHVSKDVFWLFVFRQHKHFFETREIKCFLCQFGGKYCFSILHLRRDMLGWCHECLNEVLHTGQLLCAFRTSWESSDAVVCDLGKCTSRSISFVGGLKFLSTVPVLWQEAKTHYSWHTKPYNIGIYRQSTFVLCPKQRYMIHVCRMWFRARWDTRTRQSDWWIDEHVCEWLITWSGRMLL
jgi:hypothetical protein